MSDNSNAVQCCVPITQDPIGESAATDLATVFKALSDPGRLRLVNLIACNGEMCVCDLTEPLGLSQPTVSHHLKVLVSAGLVKREQRGKWAFFTVDDNGLAHLGHAFLPDGTESHVREDTEAVAG